MKRSKYTDEQILAIVKEGEAGRKVADFCRANGITEQTYFRWKAKYGGMELSEMQRLKQLEDENRRLKHIVAEQTLDIQALKAVVAESGRPHRAARGGGALASAGHESTAGLSPGRPEHIDLAVRTAPRSDQHAAVGPPDGACDRPSALRVSATAHAGGA